MKIVKVLLPLAFLFCLSSCVEINEDIDIKKDGSGEYSMNMNMNKLLEMMQSTIGKEELEKQMPQKKMDTSILMKTLVDTSTSIPPSKKALLREGHLHMSLNMDENLFKTDMHFPFKNQDQLQQLYTSIGDGSLGTGQMLKSLSQGKGDSSENPPGGGPDFGQFNSVYTFISRSGYISRTVNKEKFKAMKESQQFGQMKQAGDMGMEVPYTITIHLPKPAKKITNTFAKLSEDKKTVTIKYNLAEVMEHPEKFEYSIEY
ncbi:MAG TPA: hypothetical protein VNV85_16470 [Puia sp.]|jgi:hypothetical protein|nr:hypothetical protein [Puia sp.]